MEIPTEISFPLCSGAHLASNPKAPDSLCSSSHCVLVITAAPWGKGIFTLPVITATHPQQREQSEQERRDEEIARVVHAVGTLRHPPVIST